MKSIFLSIFIFLGFSLSIHAQDAQRCKSLLLNEFKNVLAKDPGIINAQLTLSSIKLANLILKNQGNDSLYDVVRLMIEEEGLSELSTQPEYKTELSKLVNKFQPNGSFIDPQALMGNLQFSSEFSDNDLASLFIQLSSSNKFYFNENDAAVASLVSHSHKAVNGEHSNYIHNFVKDLLSGIKSKKITSKTIASNFKAARLKLKSELESLKSKVYKKYKDICLDYYGQYNPKGQNASVFSTQVCYEEEKEILNNILLKSINDIVKSGELSIKLPNLELNKLLGKKPSFRELRSIQDSINNLSDNKSKIIEFYKNNLGDPKCSGFMIVDKDKFTSTLYTNDGEKVMSASSIIGQGKMGKHKKFNPDSILRKWPVKDSKGNIVKRNGKTLYRYTKTTGAGVYYVDQSLNAKERSLRKYDDEFNDRVMVLYSKTEDGRKEEIQAVHGVPNEAWISNRDERLKSYDDPNAHKNLSAGCINLEGYSFDIMNDFMDNNCPIYILPQDKDNYFIVSDGQIKFRTDNNAKKKGLEHSLMKRLDGSYTDDPLNKNQYRYTPRVTKPKIKKAIGEYENNSVINRIFQEKEELFRRAIAMESDDFEDLMSLTASLETDPEKAKSVFINLYNSMYRSKADAKISQKEKRRKILTKYKEDFSSDTDIESVLSNSMDIDYEYN